MSTVFTPKEIEIFKAWIQGKKNKEIADTLQVSEPYVSQTISKIQTKVSTLENSFELLKEIGIIEPIMSLKLTNEGRKSFQSRMDIQKQKEQKMEEQVLSFTPHSLEKTIVELIWSLTSPMNMESSDNLAKRFGIPMNVIEAAKNALNQINQQNVSVAPSRAVFSGSSRMVVVTGMSELSGHAIFGQSGRRGQVLLSESPSYCFIDASYVAGQAD